MILFFGGVFLTVIPFIKTSDTFSKVGGILIGSLFIMASILTIIDYFSISGNHITFRYNLRSCVLVANGNLKAKMRRVHAIRSRRSKFIIVSHYLQAPDKEFIIFRYQMKQSEESFPTTEGIKRSDAETIQQMEHLEEPLPAIRMLPKPNEFDQNADSRQSGS